MTDVQKITDLNCGNCTTINCGFNPKCIAIRDPIFEGRKEVVMWFTTTWGCARHPLAKEVITIPVVAALKREIKDQRELQSYHKGSHSEIHRKIGDALEYAIKLITGE